MASKVTLQGGLCSNDAYTWSKQTVLQIEELSEQQVFSELQGIMEGRNYLWHSVNELLQSRFDQGDLTFIPLDGDVLFEWRNLCEEKKKWENNRCLSSDSAEFNRDCLINLMILPFQAGLGLEGKLSIKHNLIDLTFVGLRLTTANIDKLNLSTIDL